MLDLTRRKLIPVATAACVPIVPAAVHLDANDWLPCLGQEISAGDFPELFAMLGHKYGGSGNKFMLPNGDTPGWRAGLGFDPAMICEANQRCVVKIAARNSHRSPRLVTGSLIIHIIAGDQE